MEDSYPSAQGPQRNRDEELRRVHQTSFSSREAAAERCSPEFFGSVALDSEAILQFFFAGQQDTDQADSKRRRGVAVIRAPPYSGLGQSAGALSIFADGGGSWPDRKY